LEDFYDSISQYCRIRTYFSVLSWEQSFGTASYLWIVLGSIFAGAVHDYLAGMLSLRHDGESLPEIIGRYLGLTTKQVMRVFTVILMILVGAVFVADLPGFWQS
jgi:carbon starvation protein CstA